MNTLKNTKPIKNKQPVKKAKRIHPLFGIPYEDVARVYGLLGFIRGRK